MQKAVFVFGLDCLLHSPHWSKLVPCRQLFGAPAQERQRSRRFTLGRGAEDAKLENNRCGKSLSVERQGVAGFVELCRSCDLPNDLCFMCAAQCSHMAACSLLLAMCTSSAPSQKQQQKTWMDQEASLRAALGAGEASSCWGTAVAASSYHARANLSWSWPVACAFRISR